MKYYTTNAGKSNSCPADFLTDGLAFFVPAHRRGLASAGQPTPQSEAAASQQEIPPKQSYT